MKKLEGPSHGPHAGGKPGHLVVLLHGYGADGADLIGLAPVMAPLMPDVVFHAPNDQRFHLVFAGNATKVGPQTSLQVRLDEGAALLRRPYASGTRSCDWSR